MKFSLGDTISNNLLYGRNRFFIYKQEHIYCILLKHNDRFTYESEQMPDKNILTDMELESSGFKISEAILIEKSIIDRDDFIDFPIFITGATISQANYVI